WASACAWVMSLPLYSTISSPLRMGWVANTPLPWMADLRRSIFIDMGAQRKWIRRGGPYRCDVRAVERARPDIADRPCTNAKRRSALAEELADAAELAGDIAQPAGL